MKKILTLIPLPIPTSLLICLLDNPDYMNSL